MNLQPLKIPRGYRGDWPAFEYELIDKVESVITEVELARGTNASLAAELEETYATKSYVQLAIANPNPNDIYVSDLGVKLSESGFVGYTLQINGSGSLQFANTYNLANGTLLNPSIYFDDGVDAGIFVNYNSNVEDFNIKVSSGIIAKFSHNKISGENTFIFGNLQLSSGGNITGIQDLISFRRLVTTGTGAYRSEFAEIYVSTITLNTLQANNFGKILDLGVVDANALVSDTIYGKCAAGSTNLPEANAGYISHLVRGAGELIQEFNSIVTGYFYRRVKVGGVFGSWQRYAKVGGDSSVNFSVATATANDHAVTKLQFDNGLNTKAPTAGNSGQTFSVATATANDHAVTKLQFDNGLNTKAPTAGNSGQTFSVATATANDHAVTKAQLDAVASAAVGNQAIVNLVYPVASIIEFQDGTNPNTLWPWTTWTVYGEGRVTVAQKAGDFPFLTAVGGGKEITLTMAHIPEHDHNRNPNGNAEDAHISAGGGVAGDYTGSNGYIHSYTKTGKAGQASPTPVPTMPPYIVVKRWVRTA